MPGDVQVVHANSLRMPLSAGSIDVALSDLPFGLRCVRLHARIARVYHDAPDATHADAIVQVLVLGASHCGKTYLLNQVLAEKLPKGVTVSVRVSIGGYDPLPPHLR